MHNGVGQILVFKYAVTPHRTKYMTRSQSPSRLGISRLGISIATIQAVLN